MRTARRYRARDIPGISAATAVLGAMLITLSATATAAVPTLKFDSGPAGNSVTGLSSPSFRFSPSQSEAGFRCRLDREEPFTCQSPVRLPRLADGWHRFEVSLTDGLDGELETVSRRFRVDTKPPDTRVVRKTPRLIRTIRRREKAVIRFRGTERGVRLQCRLDRGRWRRCRSPFRRWAGPGRHRLRVRAIDRAGNMDPHPAVRRWRVHRWEPGISAARRYARQRRGPVSFAVDLGWRQQGFRVGLRARSASTIKTVLMTAYLNRRSVRNRSLTGSERGRLGVMIRHSDNGAASAVRDQVGARAVKRLARRAGMRDFAYSPIWGICRISARDYARFMRLLPRLLPSRHRGFALNQLASITPGQRWGVGRLRTPGWGRFFKGGWGISDGGHGGVVSHQMLLLKRGRLKIGVAILTQGNPSVGYGNQTLKGVATRLLHGLPH